MLIFRPPLPLLRFGLDFSLLVCFVFGGVKLFDSWFGGLVVMILIHLA